MHLSIIIYQKVGVRNYQNIFLNLVLQMCKKINKMRIYLQSAFSIIYNLNFKQFKSSNLYLKKF